MSANPDRRFSMADIVRETNINIASCHAILAALTDSGFLSKLADRRYALGPALVTTGQAALRSHPLIERAQKAAEELFKEIGVPVSVSTLVGDEVLSLISIPDRFGRNAGIRTGQRRPAVPVACLIFYAWRGEDEIAKFISRAGVVDETFVQEWRNTAALIRERGYQVTIVEADDYPLGQLVAELANGQDQVHDYQNRSMGLIGSSGQRLTQREQLNPDLTYEAGMIAAPIFNSEETSPMILHLGGFPRELTGTEIEGYGKLLVRTCVKIMREHRSN